MTNFEVLEEKCWKIFDERSIDPIHSKRLKIELAEIRASGGVDYILELYNQKKRYRRNSKNIFVYDLLGITPPCNLDEDPRWIEGEYPDIDTDLIDDVRDWVKNVWAPEHFGEDYVSNIGSYGTFGLKRALLDMAKIHGLDYHEIQAITKELDDKDENKNTLTFDKALELYRELADYCNNHKEVADAVKKIVNRNASIGKHAGGLVVSKTPIKDLVPLYRGTDGTPQTMWVEGLRGQDLQPVGLIKYDLLSLTNLKQIAMIKKLVKQRHGLKNLCSLPDSNTDWSDTSYLNDPKAIEIANKGDLKFIFQFHASGIRNFAKGNITCFDDLPALSSCWRPGPIKNFLHERYVKRKAGQEEYEIHPVLEDILRPTYGVMIYQETVMKMLHVVGRIPLKDCEKARKAISKKKVDQFISYKDEFVKNGQEVLGIGKEEVEKIFDQILAYSEYGFNMSHAVAYAYISARLLYLKANYPIEFFAGTLMSEKKIEKMQEAKIDARSFGRNIQVKTVDIRYCSNNFSIQKGDDGVEGIYYGIEALKGVGEAAAKKIAEYGPYVNLQDFLTRFGTESKVCCALIFVGAFPGDRRTNIKYYQFYKDIVKKKHTRDKTHSENDANYYVKLENCLKQHQLHQPGMQLSFNDEFFDQIARNNSLSEDAIKELVKLKKGYNLFKSRYLAKVENDYIPSIDEFDPDSVVIDEDWELLLDSDISVAESQYYGFTWKHELELSPDYQGDHTFEDFRNACQLEKLKSWKVEIKVLQVVNSPMKNGGIRYSLKAEDARSEVGWITVWSDDYERFQDYFKKDNLLGIRINPPHPQFKSYSLDSPPKYLRHTLPSKEEDSRVIVMRKK